MARLLLGWVLAAFLWHPAMAADPLRLYAAGSLKAALGDVARAYEARTGRQSRPSSPPRTQP